MRLRAKQLLLLATAVGGCSNVDRLLEGVDPLLGTLALTLPEADFEIPQGNEQSFAITVTRRGDFRGDVIVDVETPAGVTKTVGAAAKIDSITTRHSITLSVPAGVPTGRYQVSFRAYAARVTEAKGVRGLNVIDAQSFTLSLGSSGVTVIGGGGAPITVDTKRVNFTTGIDLSLVGPPGITGTFASNPTTGTSTVGTISVASSVAPGTYAVTIRGRAAGMPEQSVALSVVVIADRVQLLAPATASIAQGASGTVSLTVNRNDYAGPVALSAEELPNGVTSTFQPNPATSTGSSLTLAVDAAAQPGTYRIKLRGRGTGIPDATVEIALTVIRASVAPSIAPQNVTLFPTGPSASASVALARTSFTGSVSLTVEGAPSGLTVTPTPSPATGNSAILSVTATSAVAVGQYAVTIRATPTGFPASASATTTLGVTVHAPTAAGNASLTWAGCAPAEWVAFQDGTAPWKQVPVTGGVARFQIDSTQGGFAFVNGGGVTVRYLTRSELTATSFAMCDVLRQRAVTGTGLHAHIAEIFRYSFGGASATTTQSAPNFSLTGIAPGPHDFVVFGNTAPVPPNRNRVLIQRDLNPPDGASLGTINLAGGDSFEAAVATFFVQGLLTTEQVWHRMEYLTTSACMANLLYEIQSPQVPALYGVPLDRMRASDNHMVTALALSPSASRSRSVVFHEFANQSAALPAVLPAPAITTLAGSYKRLQASAPIPGVYNDSLMLQYSAGPKTMTVSHSVAYGSFEALLGMPDLSGVSGWSNGYAIDNSATGGWVLTADGSTGGPACRPNRESARATRAGGY